MSALSALRLGQEPINQTPLRKRDGNTVISFPDRQNLPLETPDVPLESTSTETARVARGTTTDPQQGLRQAQDKLNQQAQLVQTSALFESNRIETPLAMTPAGRQRATLRGMTQMGEIAFHQGSETYSTESMGQILATLKGRPQPQYFGVPRNSAFAFARG